MKITPSARILRMLGEIQFAEWQCVAELVDNAFDDFSDVLAEGLPWAGGFKVSVSLPGAGTAIRDAEVVVRDTGRGMTRSHLEQAVRAGWSG
ncbi:MAG TPA: ATP-binding protein, partial [Terriglobia bacterium]|nr:ATP-binding protein [Terriglobia bacterium]